jgi:hypothetical protein
MSFLTYNCQFWWFLIVKKIIPTKFIISNYNLLLKMNWKCSHKCGVCLLLLLLINKNSSSIFVPKAIIVSSLFHHNISFCFLFFHFDLIIGAFFVGDITFFFGEIVFKTYKSLFTLFSTDSNTNAFFLLTSFYSPHSLSFVKSIPSRIMLRSLG